MRRHSSQRMHLVGVGVAQLVDLDVVELEPAAAAPALPQLGRADAALLLADLLVERDQRVVERAGLGGPLRLQLLDLGVDLGRRRVARRRQLGDPGLGGLPLRASSSAARLCDDSSRSMTSSTTSSRSPCRLASVAISCCRLSSSLGEETWPASRRCWSRSARGAHLVDVALGLGQLAGEVALLGLGADDLVAQPPQLGRRARRARRARAASRAGGRAGRCGCPGPARRAGAAGRRRRLSAWTPRVGAVSARSTDHGSVTSGETRRLHRSPPGAAEPAAQQPLAVGQPGPLGGPVATSTSAGRAVLERLRRRVVAQVGGDVGVRAGAPARRRTGRRPLPRSTATGPHRAVRVARRPGPRRPSPAAPRATRSASVAQRPAGRPGARPARGRAAPGSGDQLEQVERRLLVGVRGAQGRDHGGTPVPGQHHLDPGLGHLLRLPDRADRRARARAAA